MRSALLPVYLKGRTATQKPSFSREAARAVPDAVSSRRETEAGCRISLAGIFQSSLAQAVEDLLDHLGLPPLFEFLARLRRNRGEVPVVLSAALLGQLQLAELSIRDGESKSHRPEAGHVDLEGEVKRAR